MEADEGDLVRTKEDCSRVARCGGSVRKEGVVTLNTGIIEASISESLFGINNNKVAEILCTLAYS